MPKPPQGKIFSSKQERFISEYVKDMNATQAAKRAGYSEHTAKEIGSEDVSKPTIQAAIEEKKAEAAKRNETTVDMIDAMHKTAYKMAVDTKQVGAMTQAAKNLAELHGLVVKKREDVSRQPVAITVNIPKDAGS